MKRFMLTLWELLSTDEKQDSSSPPERTSVGMQARYDSLVVEMKSHWGIRVHRWRSRTSGCAWELRDKSGHVNRLIESPYPKGPMSCAVFLHEVGHHAIGFKRYAPRCLEEYMAWDWALRQMESRNFNITSRVLKRRDEALRYALVKAIRRGLKRVPEPLVPFLPEGATVKPSVAQSSTSKSE